MPLVYMICRVSDLLPYVVLLAAQCAFFWRQSDNSKQVEKRNASLTSRRAQRDGTTKGGMVSGLNGRAGYRNEERWHVQHPLNFHTRIGQFIRGKTMDSCRVRCIHKWIHVWRHDSNIHIIRLYDMYYHFRYVYVDFPLMCTIIAGVNLHTVILPRVFDTSQSSRNPTLMNARRTCIYVISCGWIRINVQLNLIISFSNSLTIASHAQASVKILHQTQVLIQEIHGHHQSYANCIPRKLLSRKLPPPPKKKI